MITTFHQACTTAVNVAAPIITDGQANTLTETDLVLARSALECTNPAPATVDALAEVVALGCEYMINVDTEDPDEVGALGQLASPVYDVHWWYEQGAPR
jgi:hypothetical protein